MTFTYAAVDESPDPDEAVAWQERLNERPAIRAYKQHSYSLVGAADVVLDVGCGPGTDALALGHGRVVVGLDPSSVMCHHAAQRGIRVCRGDAVALPFADETFDACRADRGPVPLLAPQKVRTGSAQDVITCSALPEREN